MWTGIRARLAKVWFLLGMIAAVALATLAPELGRSGGPLRADRVAEVGIFAVFFLHGVGLTPDKLRAGAGRWKVHVFVQAFTFLVFPLLGALLGLVARPLVPPHLMLGFFYLCALPSTISSSVAMTALARGNVVAAMFNATLSSVLGVFLTPLLVSVAAGVSGELPVGVAIRKVVVLLLVPLAIGQLVRPVAGAAFARHRHLTGRFDRLVVLVIVWVAFCDSVRAGLWSRYGAGTIAMTGGGAALLLAIVLVLTRRVARLLRFEVEDEIAAVFCGSKKALASGVPMAKALFGAHPGLGLIVLPIMFYHQLQLFVCSVLAERYARRP